MNFTVEKAFFENDKPALLLKIQEPSYEVNIWFSPTEVEALNKVLSTNWRNETVKSGRSANSHVFWSSDNIKKIISIMIGNDDETWDICINLSQHYFLKIFNELNKK